MFKKGLGYTLYTEKRCKKQVRQKVHSCLCRVRGTLRSQYMVTLGVLAGERMQVFLWLCLPKNLDIGLVVSDIFLLFLIGLLPKYHQNTNWNWWLRPVCWPTREHVPWTWNMQKVRGIAQSAERQSHYELITAPWTIWFAYPWTNKWQGASRWIVSVIPFWAFCNIS